MRTSPHDLAGRLRWRLERLADGWPSPQAGVVAAVAANRSPGGALSSLAERPPHWIVLPCAIAEAWGDLPAAELDQILWGQLCLFLTVRIQDDLLDGDIDDPAFQFSANRFLLESLEAFERADLPTRFHADMRRCLRETSDGILEVRELEGRWGGFTEAHLTLHAKASAVLSVATAAVCFRLGRRADLRWLEDVSGRLIVVGQILDDLKDLTADLEASRFTWVANHLGKAGSDDVTSLSERRRRVCRGLLSARRTRGIFAVARSHLAAGERRAFSSAAPRGVLARLERVGESLDLFESGLHEERVRSVLGDPGALSGSPRRPA